MHSHLIYSIYENQQSLIFLPFVNTNAQELASNKRLLLVNTQTARANSTTVSDKGYHRGTVHNEQAECKLYSPTDQPTI